MIKVVVSLEQKEQHVGTNFVWLFWDEIEKDGEGMGKNTWVMVEEQTIKRAHKGMQGGKSLFYSTWSGANPPAVSV